MIYPVDSIIHLSNKAGQQFIDMGYRQSLWKSTIKLLVSLRSVYSQSTHTLQIVNCVQTVYRQYTDSLQRVYRVYRQSTDSLRACTVYRLSTGRQTYYRQSTHSIKTVYTQSTDLHIYPQKIGYQWCTKKQLIVHRHSTDNNLQKKIRWPSS